MRLNGASGRDQATHSVVVCYGYVPWGYGVHRGMWTSLARMPPSENVLYSVCSARLAPSHPISSVRLWVCAMGVRGS